MREIGGEILAGKEFTLTLHFVSCRLPSWLYGEVTEDLHPRMQALFKTKPYVKGDEMVGIQFNVKEPLDIAEKLSHTKSGQVKVSNLRKSFYLYIPMEDCHYFRHNKNEDAKIECSFDKDWLKLCYLPEWRRRDLNAVFR